MIRKFWLEGKIDSEPRNSKQDSIKNAISCDWAKLNMGMESRNSSVGLQKNCVLANSTSQMKEKVKVGGW